MQRSSSIWLWRLTAQLVLGGIGLAVVTFVGFRLGADVEVAAFGYLIVIVLASLTGSFIGSLSLTTGAVGCLNYFFAPPIFSFHIERRNDVLTIVAFLTSSLIIFGLMAKVRRLAEEAVASQKALVETIPGLVWSARPDGSRDFHSLRWLKLTGLSAEDASGEGWTAVFHHEDRAGVVEKWRRAVATGEPFEVEARERAANGEYRSMLVRAAPRRDERGNIVKWYGSSIDLEDRKRTEESLRLSEACMAHAQQLAGVGSFSYKSSYEHSYWDVPEYWSAEMWRIADFDPAMGFPPTKLVFSRIHPEDRQRMADANDHVLKKGQALDIKYRYFRADGQLRILHSLATLAHENGVPARLLGATIDITEQEQKTEALRRSEFYLSEGQRLVHAGSWSFKLDGVDNYWSTENFNITGFDPTNGPPPIGEYLAAVHPDDRKFLRDLLDKMIAEGRAGDVKFRIINPEAGLRFLRCVGEAVVENGRVTGLIGTTIDITEQEQLNHELRRRKAYLEEAQRLSQTGSFGWRVGADEISWSEQTFRIFEYDRALKPTVELVLQRTHPEDRIVLKHFLEIVSFEGKDWDFEHRLVMPDGSVKYVRAMAHATKDASGELEFVGAVMDVTATRQAEEELNQARSELAHVTRVTTVGELTAAIAHEVNQPLTGVVSSGNACLRWLAADTPNLEAAQRAVERIVRDGKRAGEVINRIRALVSRSPPRADWLNINDTIVEVMALIGREAQRDGISARTALTNDLPLVLGDRIQLQQVVLNLIMNAIEAMSEISETPRELLVESTKDRLGGVLVSVRDSGKGLDQTALDRIFDAFFTTKPAGMGMGLAISRTIIEDHGGQLWATSNRPQGAIFHFRLPTDGDHEASPAQMQEH